MEMSIEDLASALIRAGFFLPGQRGEAVTAAQDIFVIIQNPDERYPGGVWATASDAGTGGSSAK